MKYVISILVVPCAFIAGYVLPGFIGVIPRGPGSHILFLTRVVVGMLFAAGAFIALARCWKFTKRQIVISVAISLASTCLASGIIIYYLLLTVGGM